MKRIGVTASKISKGNCFIYNLSVVLIASLFSLFIFIIAGLTVTFALVVISYVGSELMSGEIQIDLKSTFPLCMICLTFVITIFNISAILKNINFSKIKQEEVGKKI